MPQFEAGRDTSAMRHGRIALWVMAAFAAFAAVGASPSLAQSLPGSFGPSQKDCQTIRTCNFARNAEVRGCLSSYSCRSCRFVPRCQTIAGKRVCDYQARCGWRGV